MASLSRQLAQWIAGLRYEDLPPEASYRKVTPMALTIRHEAGVSEVVPFAIGEPIYAWDISMAVAGAMESAVVNKLSAEEAAGRDERQRSRQLLDCLDRHVRACPGN